MTIADSSNGHSHVVRPEHEERIQLLERPHARKAVSAGKEEEHSSSSSSSGMTSSSNGSSADSNGKQHSNGHYHPHHHAPNGHASSHFFSPLTSPSSAASNQSSASSSSLRLSWCGVVALVSLSVLLGLSLAAALQVFTSPLQRGQSVLTATDWLRESETPAFLLRHGVDANPVSPRQHKVRASSVAMLRQIVESGGLVDNYNSTLIVGVVNYGYLDFALNWLCFLQRHHLNNFLLGCVDAESCEQLRLLGYGAHVVSLEDLVGDPGLKACGGAATHAFRTLCFNKAAQMKSLLVLTSLLAGYHTLMSDMDISFVQNPLLYMPLTHHWEMQLEPQEWCTGFYYNSASAFSIRMQTEVLNGVELYPHRDDQVMYNKWIQWHHYMTPQHLEQQLFALNETLFPNGKHYGSRQAVIHHNNWLTTADEKRTRARAAGLYLYNVSATAQRLREFQAQHEVNATGGSSSSWRPLQSTLLFCNRCLACEKMQPPVPPLRLRFPGPLLVSNFSAYGGGPYPPGIPDVNGVH